MTRHRHLGARTVGIMLGVVAAAQAATLYLHVPEDYPRGGAEPTFAEGSAEAERLAALSLRLAPDLDWTRPETSAGAACSRGHFDEHANYVATARGDSYWAKATAEGDSGALVDAVERIRAAWRERYGDDAVGERVSSPGTFYVDVARPRSETTYTTSVWISEDELHLTVGVPGCFDEQRRRL